MNLHNLCQQLICSILAHSLLFLLVFLQIHHQHHQNDYKHNHTNTYSKNEPNCRVTLEVGVFAALFLMSAVKCEAYSIPESFHAV